MSAAPLVRRALALAPAGPHRRDLADVLRGAPPGAVELLRAMLAYDEAARPTALVSKRPNHCKTSSTKFFLLFLPSPSSLFRDTWQGGAANILAHLLWAERKERSTLLQTSETEKGGRRMDGCEPYSALNSVPHARCASCSRTRAASPAPPVPGALSPGPQSAHGCRAAPPRSRLRPRVRLCARAGVPAFSASTTRRTRPHVK